MKRRRPRFITGRLGAAIGLLGVLATTPVTLAESVLTIEELAPGVFALRPTAPAFETWSAASNSAAVVLDDGVLFYDSHWTPANFEAARALLGEHTDLPIRYVVSSHYHGDHIGGLWSYPEGVEIISHRATRDRWVERLGELESELPSAIDAQREALAEATDETERARIENLQRNSSELLTRLRGDRPAPLPTLTFTERLELLRSGPRIAVHYLGRGHTDGDAVLYLPQEGIAFVGDLLFTDMVPNLDDGYTAEWIATLEAVLELEAERFVPGHGAVGTADDIREQIAYLLWLRGAVAPYVDEGAGAEAAVEAIRLPEVFAHYGLQWNLAGNVTRTYDELAGALP